MAEATVAADMIDKTNYTKGIRSIFDTKSDRHYMVSGASTAKDAADYIDSIVNDYHPDNNTLPLRTIKATWFGTKHLCLLRYGRKRRRDSDPATSLVVVDLKGKIVPVSWYAKSATANKPDLSLPTQVSGGETDPLTAQGRGGHAQATHAESFQPVLKIKVKADLTTSAWASSTVRAMSGRVNDAAFTIGGFAFPKHTLLFYPPDQKASLGGLTPTYSVIYTWDYQWWGFYYSFLKPNSNPVQASKELAYPEASFGAPPLS